jgi:hypothetical protein
VCVVKFMYVLTSPDLKSIKSFEFLDFHERSADISFDCHSL